MDSPNEMLKQAEHIWKMLDELADSDPDAYKNFVQKSMDEKKRATAIPEPFMCLKTELITKTSDNTFLFVNICSWTKVPAPKTSTDAVSVTGGPLEEEQSEYGSVKVTRVAINPDVLKECAQNREEMKLLVKLIFQFLENQHNFHISHKYTVSKETFFGDKSALANFFGTPRGKMDADPLKKSLEELQNLSPETLLARMNKVSMDENDLSEFTLEKESVGDVKKEEDRVLIEEISSQKFSLPKPEYELTIKEKDGTKMRRCVVRVALPGVSSVSECELEIDCGEVSLNVTGKYSLEVTIPEPFREDEVSAKFIKKTSTLSVTIPLKNS